MYLILPDVPIEKPERELDKPDSQNRSQTSKNETKEKQQFETKIGETKSEKLADRKPETKDPQKEESTEVIELTPPRTISAESFTNKRGSEVIFRREIGEPEFFLYKNELAPPRPILSKDEEEEISQKVQIPQDQTPKYTPKYILSPEFSGLSDYERGVENHKQELKKRLQLLKEDSDATETQIKKLEDELSSLDYLFENYNIGMNVFRTAKGGRSKLKT